MSPILRNLISHSCDALKKEDEYLRSALAKNTRYTADKNGLLTINNERYYQFVIARHLYAHLDYRIALESNFIDLVVYSDVDDGSYEVAVEMKRWMSSTGNPEIPGIQKDFTKLEKTNAKRRLMLVFHSSPAHVSLDDNIAYLSKELDEKVDPELWVTESFGTVGIDGIDNRFYVSGYEVCKD